MWPLPEPARPEDAERWDPPVLVRLPLDHGCDEQPERPQPRPAPWGMRTASRRP
ncbi:hypothetical protein SAMN03159343_1077 [Klenkia marina]|uniref:Uncharacterized protein n=1 Tax=Klenkia marina TaxID=1960309 RepID=A0A1G4XIP4_9ACTN|nr:hypothetical protein SAMN03159343_1077 [Klenkia marina]